jgi:hypothetical protein
MKTAIVALSVVLGVTLALGDSPNRQYAKAVASADGQYFMLVTPVDLKRRSWIWTVYKMQDLGAFKEAWTSDGAYCTHILLGNDGASVVCVESRPSGHTPKDDIVVAVFNKGKMVKSYRPSDLVQNLDSIRYSTSHYRWLAEDFRPRLEEPLLKLETVEGDTYVVDIRSGELQRQ